MDLVNVMIQGKPVVIFRKSSCCMSHSVESLIRGFGANLTVYELDRITNGQQIERALVQLGFRQSLPAVFIGQQLVGNERQAKSYKRHGSGPLSVFKFSLQLPRIYSVYNKDALLLLLSSGSKPSIWVHIRLSTPMASSSSVQTMPPASSLEISLPKSHLPDISIKLALNNYLMWKVQVIPILCGYGLFGYVKDEVPCPVSTIIGERMFLFDGPISQFISSESLHDAWKVLKTLYGTHTRDCIQQIKGELHSLTKDLLKELLANSATLKFDFKEHEQLLPLWLFIQIVVAQTQSHPLAVLHHYELKRLVSLAKMEALLELVRNKPHIMVVVDVVDLPITSIVRIILPTTNLNLNVVLVVPAIKKKLLSMS
ncbi:hypothetical protein POTOM_008772 [Populus tomentosa]|uniref:Glutaredoxin domain-containing protein n=1 Tax=Populus tomentosa TaxID=118781 RepID=A0A8X8AER5_POPTO|nr:hypothetical protein POTOM_008772 [Populus tomentosa]